MTDTATPLARATDPETSHDAAASITDRTARQRAVDVVILLYGPMTDEQLAEKYRAVRHSMGLPAQSESGLRTRRSELVRAGMCRDTGQRAFTVSGRRAILWDAAKLTDRQQQ